MYKEIPLLKEQTDYFRAREEMTGRSEPGEVAEPRVLSRSCRTPTWQCPGHKLRAGQCRMLSRAVLPAALQLLQGSPTPSSAPKHLGARGRGELGFGCGWLLGKEEKRLDATPFCFISKGLRCPSALALSSFLLSWVFLLQMVTCSAISGLDHPSPAPG